MTALAKAWKYTDRNAGLLISIVLGLAAVFLLARCAPTTSSPVSGENVSRAQLQAEAEGWSAEHNAAVDAQCAELESQAEALLRKIDQAKAAAAARAVAMTAKLDAALADLERKEQMLATVFDAGKAAVDAIGGPYATALGSLMVTAGAIANGRRKDLIISAQKNALQAKANT